MSARYFIDSNVFLYALQSDDLARAQRTGDWLRALRATNAGAASLQVMNEVANVLIKRGQLKPDQVFQIVDTYGTFGTKPLNNETTAAARIIHFETRYSWWDCLLLASALEMGCRFFLSDDLQDGRQVRGATIVNPFLHSPPHHPLH